MRLPRVRISFAASLLAVAVVAANCAVVRALYESVKMVHGGFPLGQLRFGSMAGFLPLANVAGVGICLVLGKRFGRRTHGNGDTPPSPPAACVYFSVHVLGLGAMIAFFAPSAMAAYLEIFQPLMRFIEQRGSNVVETMGDCFPWLIVECMLLGVYLSGPLLLLAWFSSRLARRCNRELPRLRFRVLTALVTLGFLSAATAIAVTPRPFWEEMEFDLAFRVVEKDSGRPLDSARVQLTDPFYPDSDSPKALTGRDGRAILRGRFQAFGDAIALRKIGTFSPWGRWLEVTATGFQPVRVALPEVFGMEVDLRAVPVHTIALTRGPDPVPAFSDLAGTYEAGHTGFSYEAFQIEPDGRFAWVSQACTSQALDYGYLRREGEVIHLSLIPCPGKCTDPAMSLSYRVIPWGDSLCLTSTRDEDIAEVCRTALDPTHTRNLKDSYCVFIRDSDRDKPLAGLPKMPLKVWGRYVLFELVNCGKVLSRNATEAAEELEATESDSETAAWLAWCSMAVPYALEQRLR